MKGISRTIHRIPERLISGIFLVVGIIFFVSAIFLAVDGIKASDRETITVATINNAYANSTPYPVIGERYGLEARIINETSDGTTSNNIWYHGAIYAEPGDILEVRFKASFANSSDVDRQIARRLSFMPSEGLVATTIQPRIDTVILSDGSSADYPEEFDDREVYVRVGYYELSRKNWWSGTRSLEMLAYLDGDTEAHLFITEPYCRMDTKGIAENIGLTVFFWIGAFILGKMRRGAATD